MGAKHASTAASVSARVFALRCGMRLGQVIYYCRTGRIQGARRDPVTLQWSIFPPAKLLPRQQHG